MTGIVTQSAAANGEAVRDLNRFWPQCQRITGVVPAFATMRGARLNSPQAEREEIGPSVVAVSAFHPLVPLLSFDAEGGDGPGFETANADRFVRLFAITVCAVVYTV